MAGPEFFLKFQGACLVWNLVTLDQAAELVGNMASELEPQTSG